MPSGSTRSGGRSPPRQPPRPPEPCPCSGVSVSRRRGQDTDDQGDHQDDCVGDRPLPPGRLEVRDAVPALVPPGELVPLEEEPERHEPADKRHKREEGEQALLPIPRLQWICAIQLAVRAILGASPRTIERVMREGEGDGILPVDRDPGGGYADTHAMTLAGEAGGCSAAPLAERYSPASGRPELMAGDALVRPNAVSDDEGGCSRSPLLLTSGRFGRHTQSARSRCRRAPYPWGNELALAPGGAGACWGTAMLGKRGPAGSFRWGGRRSRPIERGGAGAAGRYPRQPARAADVAGRFAHQYLSEMLRVFVPHGGIPDGLVACSGGAAVAPDRGG